jgi:hypothetical protein
VHRGGETDHGQYPLDGIAVNRKSNFISTRYLF